MLKTALFAVALVLLAQSEAPPALTDVQRLQITVLAQRIEIAQLKAQAAQRDFDAARSELTTLVQSLQVQGYTFDLSTLTYTKVPE